MPTELALASSADFADRPNTLMPPLPIRRAEITVSVVVRRYWNNTGLHVTAGQHYRLVALGTWVDLYIWRDADGYATPWWLEWAPPGPLARTIQARRRLPEGTGSCWSVPVRAAGDCQCLVAGNSREVWMPASGQLAFFANDVPGFHWNNLGSMRPGITRLS